MKYRPALRLRSPAARCTRLGGFQEILVASKMRQRSRLPPWSAAGQRPTGTLRPFEKVDETFTPLRGHSFSNYHSTPKVIFMNKSVMIVGVGGQGTLLASRILGDAMMDQGYDVKVSEVHGMSSGAAPSSPMSAMGTRSIPPLSKPARPMWSWPSSSWRPPGSCPI